MRMVLQHRLDGRFPTIFITSSLRAYRARGGVSNETIEKMTRQYEIANHPYSF